MKTITLAVAVILLLSSCGEKQDKINNETNPNLELKETLVPEIGISVGLPANWEVKYCCCLNRDSTFEVIRSGKIMMNIVLKSDMKNLPMNIITNNFNYEAGKDEPIQEGETGGDVLKRMGAIGKGTCGGDTGLVKTFYYEFKWQTQSKKPIKVEPASDYTGKEADTCIAILKSIKASK